MSTRSLRSIAKRLHAALPLGIRRFLFRGRRRYCPVCESSVRRFLVAGSERRRNAQCPVCGSLERHRLFRIVLRRYTDVYGRRNLKVLHVAPEECIADLLKDLPGVDYLSADLESSDAMVRMDITDIDYPDDSFDVIQCSHVLEHVQDDKKAMREFARVLAPAGWCLLQVPVTASETFEDPTITDPEERLRLFGQRDHVRRYGPDVVKRMEKSGLFVTVVTTDDVVTPEGALQLGLMPGDGIYVCQLL